MDVNTFIAITRLLSRLAAAILCGLLNGVIGDYLRKSGGMRVEAGPKLGDYQVRVSAGMIITTASAHMPRQSMVNSAV